MKAFSLYQPWASLVVCGAKKYETRSWSTDYRGLLAIHAGLYFPLGSQLLALGEPFYSHLKQGGYDASLLPTGVFVGVVELVDVFKTEDIYPSLSEDELAFGDYRMGRYAWKLENPKKLHVPIKSRGWQRLWNINDDIWEYISRGL